MRHPPQVRTCRLFFLALSLVLVVCPAAFAVDIIQQLAFFSGFGDRSSGSPGGDAAAEYILKAFGDAGIRELGSQEFLLPVPEVESASLELGGETVKLYPWGPNLVYLPMTPEEGLSGPIVYVGDGRLERFQGQQIEGGIVLMDMASTGNWMNAATLGAIALVFLGDRDSIAGDFREKDIPTPLAFPRFWAPSEAAEKLRQLALQGNIAGTVKCTARWRNKPVKNCYALIPGRTSPLKDELIVVEAFYDASSHILGLAPGADEATSIAVLLELAKRLMRDPPERSVLLVATAGHGQGLAGMREFIWAATTRKKSLKDQKRALDERKGKVDHQLQLLQEKDPLALESTADRELVWQVVVERAKDLADHITREIQYQKALAPKREATLNGVTPEGVIPEPAVPALEQQDPRPYRRLSWLTSKDPLNDDERALAMSLLKDARADLKAEVRELGLRVRANKSSQQLRSVLGEYTPVVFMSLYLSSHAPSFGLVELGDTYPLREPVKRQIRAFRLNEILGQLSSSVARETGLPNLFQKTSRMASGEGGHGTPPGVTGYCCDVAAVAELPAVTLATLEDHRALWGTPYDTLDRLDRTNLERLANFLPQLIAKLSSHAHLAGACEGGIRGFASINGQALFTRQGELFPDQPAAGTLIAAIQGDSIFRTMVYRDGTFHLPGVANKRVAFQKVILEPYGLDPLTGRVAWTADKNTTDKENYRVKVSGESASVSLNMFHCRQSDVINIFDPRKMDYLTKVQLLDGATGATPLRYWYSRVDGRNTPAISIFLEKGTRFKLIMSDNLLRKELILLNGSPERPEGRGFLIGDPPSIPIAPFQVAQDTRYLLAGRIENLHQRGIVNRHLEGLYESSVEELNAAQAELAGGQYGRFWDRVVAAWAKLNVVYAEVEGTQRDVLTGVLFFIALFVPFAYCMERYLFCFRNIYQQIVAFFLILLMTIFTIKALHPAFQLTYNPMVVIIAFFIVGLSLLVSWIIFLRFEREMAELQRHAHHLMAPQVSKWQAFGAGFTIGVSNLNRRKMRTALTCTTLVILTFTVMSFTNVKSFLKTTHTRTAGDAPYRGILLRHQYWKSLLPMTLEDMRSRFSPVAAVWPRAWIDRAKPSERTLARLYGSQEKGVAVEGILGLGVDPPEHIRSILTNGRWFEPGEQDTMLLSTAMARQLGMDPKKDRDITVTLWGSSFKVIGYFDGSLLENLKDLDQNPLTPAYLETGQNEELTEAEVEAMQTGEEVLPLTERFRYANANATVIVSYETSLAYGGKLKAIAIVTDPSQSPLDLADQLSTWLSLPLFVGDGGTWFHSASTALRYQGVANLAVPILIVIFICLNTLIGHVHERRKEISIYTAVGLAPTHVGFLFIVEAMSLAVISTVIGYILAQLTAKYLGNTALFSQLTFNYSSLASVACMFLVFSVVFLASLYPARLAAEMAMPDVNRSWTLPAPEADLISMNLPFLMNYEEEKGIMGFLAAFFISHQDIAQGAFIVDDTNLLMDTDEDKLGTAEPSVCLFLRSNVWLAPFDFGIKQALVLHLCASSENPGYLEIALQMKRISGEQSAWVRANKYFIKALRKQMLLWRLLDPQTKARYRLFVPEQYLGQDQAVAL